jgi:dephospho-CoA kinase
MNDKMLILVLGHGGHGKSEVGRLLGYRGHTWMDSSRFAFEKVVYPVIGHRYESMNDCYADRRNCREEWFNLISGYNNPANRLAKELTAEYNVYIGMRSMREFVASWKMFDLILWVDRTEHMRLDVSMEISFTRDIMTWIDNNGTIEDTAKQLVQHLANYERPGLQQTETG